MRPGVRLGIDVGEARIGVAASDPSGLIATPVETVAAGETAIADVLRLAGEHEAVEVVVGLPRSLSGAEGPAAVKARGFATGIATAGSLPVRLVDERLTTVTATAVLREQGRPGKRHGQRRRQVVDQVAAVVILQHALDTERSTGTPAGELVIGSVGVEGDNT